MSRMKMKMLTTVFLVAGLVANAANAQLITFDDIQNVGTGIIIQNGYSGLNWDQFYVTHAAQADPGYNNAAVSSPNVAYNQTGGTATISNPNGFNLISGYFTGPYDNTTVDVTTTGGTGQQLSFAINNTSPTLVTFDFYNLTSASFSNPTGMTNFALDNLTVTNVPIPAAFWLFGSAMAGLAVIRKRRAI